MKNLLFCILFTLLILVVHISVYSRLKEENRRLKNNQELLLSDKQKAISSAQTYKIADSLNAMKISALELTLREYKRCRDNDLSLIKQLKSNNANLKSIISTQISTLETLSAKLKDSVIVDTMTDKKYTYKHFSYLSEWTEARGYIDLQKDTIKIQIKNKESLKVVESVVYKRFLGFLWKTNKIKERQVSVTSLNPNTEIKDCEYILIKQ